MHINTSYISEFERLISTASDIVISTHMRPDGDAAGSSVAAYHYLKSIGKNCKIVISDPLPQNLEFLREGVADGEFIIQDAFPMTAAEALQSCNLILCLDFNAFHRTGGLEELLNGAACPKILIDHHLSPDRDAFSLIISETEVSSTCELLYHVLMNKSDIRNDASALPRKSAVALMTGMTTDTNNFANSVFPETLRMASALLESGVDRDSILQHLYNMFSENRLRLMGHMMKDLLKITEDGVAYIVLDRKTQLQYRIQEGDTEGFVNMPLSIKDVVMSILLKEDKDRVRVSIRSKKGTSANRCAKEHFNGGGHENASGGRLYIGEDIASIEDAASYIERHTNIFMNNKNE